MPEIQLPVTGPGPSAQWATSGGATPAECVQDAGDGKNATTDGFGRLDLHEMADLPASATGVTSFKTRLVAFDTGSAPTKWRAAIRLGATTLYSGEIQSPVAPTLYTFTWARPGGGAWSVADVNATKIGYESVVTAPVPLTGEPRIDDCRGVCVYTEPTGPITVEGTAVLGSLTAAQLASLNLAGNANQVLDLTALGQAVIPGDMAAAAEIDSTAAGTGSVDATESRDVRLKENP